MSDERYQQRQQRVKEKVDARVAQAQDERGIIIVFNGEWKRQNHRGIWYGNTRSWSRKKWASCSLLKAPGLMVNEICWSHTALSFR